MTSKTKATGTAEPIVPTATNVITLAITDPDGYRYAGRFDGRLLAEEPYETEVYETDTGRILLYDLSSETYSLVADPEEDLRSQLNMDRYLEVMFALGIRATVDLDV